MNYEVEQKYAIKNLAQTEAYLEELNIQWGDRVVQRDAYYNHPSRNFAETDEALRIRASATETCITYKGPRVDQVSKTRSEMEIPLGEQSTPQQAEQLLQALGFVFVDVVEKQRRSGSLTFKGQQIEIAVDDVVGLGQFIEIEMISSADDLVQAQQLVQQVATALRLTDGITAGYLDLQLRG